MIRSGRNGAASLRRLRRSVVCQAGVRDRCMAAIGPPDENGQGLENCLAQRRQAVLYAGRPGRKLAVSAFAARDLRFRDVHGPGPHLRDLPAVCFHAGDCFSSMDAIGIY